MKWLTLLLTCLLLLIVAAVVAPIFRSDPGYVLIRFQDWTAETSVLVLALGLIALYLLIRLVLWLWNWPARTFQRAQQVRSQKQLEKGLLALTEGDWQGAEKALAKSRNPQGQETVKYLAAARAAQGQQDSRQRDSYLLQADSGGSKNRFLVQLSRAKLLLANGDTDAARAVLEALQKRRKKHPQVLELLSNCYRQQGDWRKLRKLIPVLMKTNLVDAAEAERLKRLAAQHELQDAADVPELSRSWKKFPAAIRQDTELLACYARQALDLGADEVAEAALRSGLRQQWDSRLIRMYGEAALGQPAAAMKQCEKWLDRHEDADLHFTMGRLCASQQLWGKAKQHLLSSLDLQPSGEAYQQLGELMEKQGEIHAAMACFQNALRLSRGEAPKELPNVLSQRLEATRQLPEPAAADTRDPEPG